MTTKNTSVLIALGALIIGLALGYFAGVAQKPETPTVQMGMHGAMGGMMMGLQGKTGDALDEAFLQGMIIHHQGAVEMAEALLDGTKRPELIQLANDIISAQTKEIEMMRGWLQEWF